MLVVHTDGCYGHNRYLQLFEQECICGASAANLHKSESIDTFTDKLQRAHEKARRQLMDEVNHPSHYTSHAGVECIDIAETMTFNRGNALKYVWRAGLKSDDVVKDLKKAVWYLNREIGRLQKLNGEEDKPEEHRTAVTPTINGLGEAPGELASRFHSGG